MTVIPVVDIIVADPLYLYLSGESVPVENVNADPEKRLPLTPETEQIIGGATPMKPAEAI